MLQFIFGYCNQQKMPQNVETSESSWMPSWLKWSPTSVTALENAEQKLLSFIKTPFVLQNINIPSKNNEGHGYKIRTLSLNAIQKKQMPLVLLHGFASGIGLWVLNLDALAHNRPVHAFDMLGFGMSSRPQFGNEPDEVENQLVESIEQWRQSMGLEKFVLLGHSMGGFLASAYAIKHPDKISHLILADPWGFPDFDKNFKIRIPLWAKTLGYVLQYFNPLASLRAAGPWGPGLVEKLRPDIVQKFSVVVDEPDVVANYIYHCNAQTPSGETAFKVMSLKYGWAKSPMIPRIAQLKTDIPITFIFGSNSWIDSQSGNLVKEMRKNSFVDVKFIKGAGHHVYADDADEFNTIVQDICSRVDEMLLNELNTPPKFWFKESAQKVTQDEKFAILNSCATETVVNSALS